jgi:hypothetical protein
MTESLVILSCTFLKSFIHYIYLALLSLLLLIHHARSGVAMVHPYSIALAGAIILALSQLVRRRKTADYILGAALTLWTLYMFATFLSYLRNVSHFDGIILAFVCICLAILTMNIYTVYRLIFGK